MEHSEDFPSFPPEAEDELTSDLGERSPSLGLKMGGHPEKPGGGEDDWEDDGIVEIREGDDDKDKDDDADLESDGII